RKRRRNLKQLHRDLMAVGFDGSYGRWRRRNGRKCQKRRRRNSLENPVLTQLIRVLKIGLAGFP
ncbi:MAG: hypothetical protein O2805_10120, partial [Proteobacteria bacterium]|nr:hypothetical protein [Pseudomonadota bacterium]